METYAESPTIENYKTHPFLAALESGAIAGGPQPAPVEAAPSPARAPALASRTFRAASPGLPPRRCTPQAQSLAT